MPRQTKKRIDVTEVEKFLHGLEYPAFRNNLIDHAVEHGAPDEILDALWRAPDEEYQDETQVIEAVMNPE